MIARKPLPNRRRAETFELTVGGLRYVCTVGRFADGRVGELFLSNHKIKQHRRYERTQRGRQNCINCITLYPLGWRVMRCTCKGWV
jgi:hypothetical protein